MPGDMYSAGGAYTIAGNDAWYPPVVFNMVGAIFAIVR